MMEVFLNRLAEVLEVASLAAQDDYRRTRMWSSLTGFAVLLMIEREYGRKLTLVDLESFDTVAELAAEIGVA